jgi:hypothetical protein
VTQVSARFAASGVPGGFGGIDFVQRAALRGLVADVVKDEELRLGADVAGVGDAGGFQIGNPLLGNAAGVFVIELFGDGIDDVGDCACSMGKTSCRFKCVKPYVV